MDGIEDTICALATGAPPAGIAIIRVSGPEVAAFAEAHIRGALPAPHVARLRTLVDNSGNIVDQALTIFMPAGASYSGQDVLELHVHGGVAVIEHALDTLTNFSGIRLAGPGEFTRRAFEAGRLDLTQAEGIADLIDAETRAQKSQALAQTDGALSSLYAGWRQTLLECLSLLEASIDFPDEAEAPQTVTAPVLKKLGMLESEFDQALRQGRIDQSVRDGFRIAIIGAPNAGKSTLLNRFAKRDAAIVTDIPGTTRDVLEVRCRLGGQVVWFMDTAGLRETEDVVEAEGVRRAKRAASDADLRIYLSAGEPNTTWPIAPSPDDLIVRNKADLIVNEVLTPETLTISALTGAGTDALEMAIVSWLTGRTTARAAPVITRVRHRVGIEDALSAAQTAAAILTDNGGAELASEEVRLAARALASLVGQIGVEDVLGAVFSEFCIGK